MKYLVGIRHISQRMPIRIRKSRNLEENHEDKDRPNRKLPVLKVVDAGHVGVFTCGVPGSFQRRKTGTGSLYSGRRTIHSFADGDDLYLIRGYGEQKSGGYSIAVDACTEDDEKLYLTTRLIGPKDAEKVPEDASYPYIVVRVAATEKEVEIQ